MTGRISSAARLWSKAGAGLRPAEPVWRSR
jgi:hypothetical protein